MDVVGEFPTSTKSRLLPALVCLVKALLEREYYKNYFF